MRHTQTAEKPMNQRDKTTTFPTTLTPLYRHVFYGRFTIVVVLLLLCSILLQPVDRAFANEPPETVPAPIDTSVITTEASVPVADIPEPAVPVSTATDLFEPEATTTSLLNDPGSLAATTTPPELEVIPVEEVAVTGDGGSDIPAVIPEESASDAGGASVGDATVPNESNDTSVTDEATSSATTTGEVLEARVTVSSDSQIQFEKSDCVAVADGSYYCKTKAPTPSTDVKDGLYSQPDADGDLEIYFAHNGVLDQVTHNTTDDASPYFDAVSNTIVWHRQIDDRYQIISYDVSSGAESQLTTDTVNNMEPTRVGVYTAWQHWNNDNWDIMLHDGATTKLLTNTPEHDIAPKIRGNLVMWNRMAKDTQTIELYDLTTGEYTTIADAEGGELSNPRMVLVYDAAFANGDVVTKGYDVLTGKITPLSAVPASIPDEIPDPDTTGETRALIQSKAPTREDSDNTSPQPPTIDPPLPGATASSTASSSEFTLDLQSPVATTTPVVVPLPQFTLDMAAATATLRITESDVLVPAFTASTTD